MLTIIIPIKQSWIKPDCFLRLLVNLYRLKWLRKRNGLNFKILVADDSHPCGRILIWLITKFFKEYYLHISSEQTHYTPAYVKNKSANYAFSELDSTSIFYLDVDVLLNQQTLLDLYKKNKEQHNFDWYPVDFLGEKNGFKQMLYAITLPELEKFSGCHVLQTGYVTGAHFIGKELFYKLNGYSTQFTGYGCEDIELIHRATLILGLRPTFAEDAIYYLDDRGYNAEALHGFRNFYYKLKQKETQTINYPKHFWHKRKNKSNYLKNRKQNDLLMIQLMKDFDRNWHNVDTK